jgi:hypothetical protein
MPVPEPHYSDCEHVQHGETINLATQIAEIAIRQDDPSEHVRKLTEPHDKGLPGSLETDLLYRHLGRDDAVFGHVMEYAARFAGAAGEAGNAYDSRTPIFHGHRV